MLRQRLCVRSCCPFNDIVVAPGDINERIKPIGSEPVLIPVFASNAACLQALHGRKCGRRVDIIEVLKWISEDASAIEVDVLITMPVSRSRSHDSHCLAHSTEVNGLSDIRCSGGNEVSVYVEEYLYFDRPSPEKTGKWEIRRHSTLNFVCGILN